MINNVYRTTLFLFIQFNYDWRFLALFKQLIDFVFISYLFAFISGDDLIYKQGNYIFHFFELYDLGPCDK